MAGPRAEREAAFYSGCRSLSHPWSSSAVLGKLAATYVETIRSGAVPCLESAVLALAKIENAAAVKEAVALYQRLMAQRAKLPTETAEELLELHGQCEQETLDLFTARALEDGVSDFREDLMVGGPQRGQDYPRDTIIPLGLGR